MSGPGKLLAGGRSRQRIKRPGVFHARLGAVGPQEFPRHSSEGGFVRLKRFASCPVRLRRGSSNSTSLRRLPLCMENGPVLHHGSKHFLEAKRLCAKLRIVVVEGPPATFLVLDRDKTAILVRSTISHLPDRPPFGLHRQRAKQCDVSRNFISRKVGMLTRQTANNGMLVLAPPAFDGLERRATRAVEIVVEKAEGKWIHSPGFGNVRFPQVGAAARSRR